MTKCKHEGCKKRACFNITGETKGIYCLSHVVGNMENVVDKKCIYDGCKTRPNFNVEGETQKLFCSKHKSPEMVSHYKKCIVEGCNIIPNFNNKGETIAKYCANHKTKEMIDINHPLCKEDGCSILPSFNYKGEKIGIYCETHKKTNMQNVTSRRCIHEGCDTIATFYKDGSKKIVLYCRDHKPDDTYHDLHRKCSEEGCKTRPTFNDKGEKTALWCKAHKEKQMVDVINKICMYENCESINPCFNIKGEKAGLFCSIHKSDIMINVVSPRCKSEWCDSFASPTLQGYCRYCFTNLFPDDPKVSNYKTKERSVVDFIISTFPDFTWINDKRIQDGCSKRRPDLILDLGFQVVIIEVDENNHTSYDCSCENKRLMQLSQDINHRPMVMIRFNPDAYVKSDGRKAASCWAINKATGLLRISSMNKWTERLQILKETVEYWTTNHTDKLIEVIELFSDQDL